MWYYSRMTATLSDIADFRIIDTDTHLVEPPDLWTSRVSVKKWGEKVPHMEWSEERQREVWLADGQVLGGVHLPEKFWTEEQPQGPKRWEELPPKYWRAQDRLQAMTEYGIYGAVLYPNVMGFGAGKFAMTSAEDAELALELIRAYNDFLVEYSKADPKRYIPVAGVPFWDVEESVKELQRAAAIGHKGALFSQDPRAYGQPHLADPHWDPIWACAQDLGFSINFHVASGDMSEVQLLLPNQGVAANMAANPIAYFVSNSRTFSILIGAGICHRFPRLNFVSVESGVSWIPFAFQAFDWEWKENVVTREHPEYDLLPSEYFKRQMYGCFWFETGAPLDAALEYLGPDNLLYETDYPHPTTMTPSRDGTGDSAKEFVTKYIGHWPKSALQKVLHDNAARVYHMD
jgi:predicted TIM-barrel fold metal-dependent hydrolase